MTAPFLERRVLERGWRDPAAVAAGLSDREGLVALVSDGDGPAGRLSHVGCEPDLVRESRLDEADPFAALRDPAWASGVVGLAAYDGGARPATGERGGDWPDLILARYPSWLTFDHVARRITAVGRGIDAASAEAAARRAAAWLDDVADPRLPAAPAEAFAQERPEADYLAAVADVIGRIAGGELFQANIARAWGGRLRPGASPFAVFQRLQAGRAAAYGAVWRIGDRAVVSNSPELFLRLDAASGRIETRPIKGTRPRGADPASDAALAAELSASAKDRAENLMIVDLMRNDLARAAVPGSVEVERLFAVESLPTVHHLVSTVTATLRPGAGSADLLAATFPPGSITGAPKHQAMRVIAGHEPPRGPWCGSLFLIDDAGGLTASVLIRTAHFHRDAEGWRFRTLAGAGVTADSDPAAELAETGAKIRALREALVGDQLE